MSQELSFELEPRTLWTDALDNRGLLAQPSPYQDGHLYEGMHRVVSLEDTAHQIGGLIMPHHAQSEQLALTLEAAELNITELHRWVAQPKILESGLRRYPQPGNRRIDYFVRVYNGHTDLKLPGMVDRYTAVAFHPDDHKRLAHSPVYLASHSSSTTRSANPIVTNSGDRTEQDRKSNSSAAKSMVSKMRSIDLFDQQLQDDHALFSKVTRDLRERPEPPVRYLPHNAHNLLTQADSRLRKIVELSLLSLKETGIATQDGTISLTPEDIPAVQRAVTFELYNSGATANAWRNYMKLARRHVNAQRGKLDESRNASLAIYKANRHAIKLEELEEYDAIAYRLPPQTQIATAA